MQSAKRFFVAAAILLLASNCNAQSDKEDTKAFKVGDKVNEFKLTSEDEKFVESKKQFGEKGRPAILLFSRANW